MKGIQLKLKGEWIALPEDFSLKLEQTNPLFNEQGTFSFPFEVPLAPNRSIFKNIADPFGDIRLKDIDGMEAELWFNGVMIYKGLVETDEEVEFENSIPLTFLSGNGDFMKRIEGLNAQDVPLDREIKLGYVVFMAEGEDKPQGLKQIDLPFHIMMNYTEFNVSDPYPIKPYCNVRVCTSDENGKYKTLEAKRPFSGVCFYMLYLIECLFKHLDFNITRNDLLNIEDLSRLAFFTTKCNYTLGDEIRNIELSTIKEPSFCGPNFNLKYKNYFGHKFEISTEEFTYKSKDVFSTNKNFPDVSVKDLIEDLNTAFGIRILYDEHSNSVRLVLLKDILNNSSIVDLELDVLSATIKKNKHNYPLVTYNQNDNLAFNYEDFTNIKKISYADIDKKSISANDKSCYIDPVTGNTYRIKVNKETGKEPALFEVAGFRDYTKNPMTKEDSETMSINYSPVIVNDVNVRSNESGDDNNQLLAIFADVELKSNNEFNGTLLDVRWSNDDRIYSFELRANFLENYDFLSNDESPLSTYDAGYTLGIMRGPGNKSKVEYVENYDREGNSSWTQVVANYAFTSDSCDNYGRFFDYNGTEAGGADQTGRFSLKLIAEKDGFPIDSNYANRGLVSKFLSEYLYFLEHRKTVLLEVKMHITQLINIDFLKRYKIGEFVGFINKVSYTMTAEGMEDVTIEMYTL